MCLQVPKGTSTVTNSLESRMVVCDQFIRSTIAWNVTMSRYPYEANTVSVRGAIQYARHPIVVSEFSIFKPRTLMTTWLSEIVAACIAEVTG